MASKPTPPGLPVNLNREFLPTMSTQLQHDKIAVGEDAAYRIDEDTRMWQVMFR